MEKYYLAAICSIVPGLGRKRLPKLLKKLGGAEAVFNADIESLRAAKLCTENQIQNFINTRKSDLPKKIEDFCKRQSVNVVSFYDRAYPKALKEISDPPLVLYVKGELPSDDYAVAVVGSREASPYGLKAAEMFAAGLAKENVPVVSGGARGIDTAAHKACVEAGGRTVAVLGCGIDITYPVNNQSLFEQIVEAGGALVTEYPPGTPPLGRNFPARNRIIVGLARAVVVAEAARQSGALITANIAADEAREVYCVPGNIFTGINLGCHDLIRTGAKLVDGVQDVLEDRMYWRKYVKEKTVQPSIFDASAEVKHKEKAVKEEQPKIKENKPIEIELSETGKQLVALLKQEPMSIVELTEKSGAIFGEVSMELLEMQVAGLITTDNAQRYYLL